MRRRNIWEKKLWIRFKMRSGKNLFAQGAKRRLEFGLTMMQLKDFRWAAIIAKLWLAGTRGPALACRPVGYRQHCDCRYSIRLATYNSSIWSDLLDINKSLSFNHIVSWRALLLRWLAVITSGGISKDFVLSGFGWIESTAQGILVGRT